MKSGFKIAVSVVILIFCLGLLMPAAYARGDKKMQGHQAGFENKIFLKAHMMLKNQEELGLSAAQIKKIKKIKIDIKKDLIQRKAKIDLIVVDIKAQMWEDKINTKAINKLIDQKYELKKAKAKSLLQAYVSLKKILTDEQKERLKEFFKACKKKKAKH